MSVYDDIDFLRRNAGGSEILQQLRRLAVNLRHLCRQLISNASLYQYGVGSGSYQQRVQADGDAVLRVGSHLAFPHKLGHNTEQGATIEVVGTIGNDGQFEITKGEAL